MGGDREADRHRRADAKQGCKPKHVLAERTNSQNRKASRSWLFDFVAKDEVQGLVNGWQTPAGASPKRTISYRLNRVIVHRLS